MGAFLAQQPRDAYTLSTKVGRLLLPQDADGRMDGPFAVAATHRRVWDFSRDGIRRSVEDSLARMGVDRFDTLYLHDAEPHFDPAPRRLPGARGDARGGRGGCDRRGDVHDQADDAGAETDADVVMVAAGYTLLNQGALDNLLPACEERGVSIVAAAIFHSGLLADARPAADAFDDYAPASAERLERARRIAGVCEAHGVTLPQAAIAFPLLHPVVTGVVIGMRSAEEVRRNVASFGTAVPVALWADLRAAGLLDERAPAGYSRSSASAMCRWPSVS